MNVQHGVGAQKRILDQSSECADADGIRLGKPDPIERLRRVHAFGLVELEPEQAGGIRHRRRPELAAASAGPVGPGDHQLGPVL